MFIQFVFYIFALSAAADNFAGRCRTKLRADHLENIQVRYWNYVLNLELCFLHIDELKLVYSNFRIYYYAPHSCL